MLEFLAGNLQALAAVQPTLALPAARGRVRCVDGVWRVGDGERGIAIHGRDPAREADALVASLLTSHPGARLMAVVGLGLGFVLDALERRQWDGRVIAFEPDPDTVSPMLARRDWQGWIGADRLRLLVGPSYDGSQECQRLLGDGSSEVAVLVNPVMARLAPAEVETALKVLARLRFDVQANTEARRRHGTGYLLNTLANLRAIAAEGDAATLAGALAGVPAVVVGAGPSLDSVLDDLRRLQHSAAIVCVDTALRPLVAAGIAPHLVVAVDPGEANARHLWDPPPCPDTYLVAEASLAPAALDAFRGRSFLFSVSNHEPWPWLTALGHGRGRVRAWGSVLTSAFDVALQLGCDPIVFVGSDLAFTGDRPYARGIVYEEDWKRLFEWGVPYEEQWRDQVGAWPRVDEPDIHGRLTRTASHLVAFRDWLAEQTRRESRHTFVNATGGGILHGGRLMQQSLSDAGAAWRDRDASIASGIAGRYQPTDGAPLLAAARALADRFGADASGDAQEVAATLKAWERFAGGIDRRVVSETLQRALRERPIDVSPPAPGAAASMAIDPHWMTSLAGSLSLAWFAVPPVRMEAHAAHARKFRSRSTLARLAACALAMPEGAVAEDGRPLRQGAGIDGLQPGEYFIWRDEVYFASTDGTDPRGNHRRYTVLMPACVASIEQLPLHEILEHAY